MTSQIFDWQVIRVLWELSQESDKDREVKINTQFSSKQELSLILVWCDLCFARHAWHYPWIHYTRCIWVMGGILASEHAGFLSPSCGVPSRWASVTVASLGIQSFLHTSLEFCFCLAFLLHYKAYGILVPRPGMEPVPPAVEAQSPNHWTTRVFSPLSHLGDLMRKSKGEVWTVLRIIDWLTFAVPLFVRNFRLMKYSLLINFRI